MIEIDYNEFKMFKRYTEKEGDNFELLLEFLKSYYNMVSTTELYETLKHDDIAQMMLKKRDINSSADLENILFQNFL